MFNINFADDWVRTAEATTLQPETKPLPNLVTLFVAFESQTQPKST